MFTIQQIKDAHSKVKSGADFPAYIQDLIALGLMHYTFYVADGHTIYTGREKYTQQSEARYAAKEISDLHNLEAFMQRLKIHQQGQTDYLTFCQDCAETGVNHWIVDLGNMTCTYYDKSGSQMLEEKIPS